MVLSKPYLREIEMSLCCEECFSDDYLKRYIRDHGHRDDCDFCGSEDICCIEPVDLAELFFPVVSLYSIVEDFMPVYEMKQLAGGDGEMLWEKLDSDWMLFNLGYGAQEELMHSMFSRYDDPRDGGFQLLHSFVEDTDVYWGERYRIAEELDSEWSKFCSAIKYKNRYSSSGIIDIGYLCECLKYFIYEIKPGEPYYRARNSYLGKKIPPRKMGKPPAGVGTGGRANPKGIPYLYMASNIDTAISEIRPSGQDRVSVGTFRSNKSLILVDLRTPLTFSPFQLGNDIGQILDYFKLLRRLGEELSRPIHHSVTELEYIPLQYLCETIKNYGYDGIVYSSSLGSGYNVAVFADDSIKCVRSSLYKVTGVKVLHEKVR